MINALIGSHGTGKTSVLKKIQEQYPDWQYFTEGARHQTVSFGYNDPYEIINRVGIGAYEMMNINGWSIIDPKANTSFRGDVPTLLDRSPLDNFGYFLALAKPQEKHQFHSHLLAMTRHYASFIDRFFYFPTGIVPLVGDDMRPSDHDYQEKVDLCIKKTILQLPLPKNKLVRITSTSLDDRVQEVLSHIIS